MTPLKIEEEVASIVLLGSFNPAIFQPSWLAQKGLLGASEAEGAILDVVHPEVASFRTGWLTLSVTRNKFIALTSAATHFAPLRDLVLGVFELLEHTPVTALGLNRALQYRLGSKEARDSLGDKLMPKDRWDGVLDQPKLRTLTAEGARTDALVGKLNIRIEPAANHIDGVFFEFNNDLRPSREDHPVAELMSIVRTHHDRLMRDAAARAEAMLKKAGF
ncbi:MAG: hypothetical protein HYV09_26175 [Deltaproteobacteria bacterium]|nr:hypothetical protein [Deltaproteobacteria bacterium]